MWSSYLVISERERNDPAKERKSGMSPHMKFGIAGVIIGLILFAVLPWYVPLLIIAAAIAIPAVLYAMLDPSQRRRLRRARGRKQLGN
jgi:Flp pilus assembly protein TadB